MNTKPILQSKTLWLNLIALLLLLWPAAKAWVAANPIEPLAVLTAANIILRFFSQGRISLWADEDSADQEPAGADDARIGNGARSVAWMLIAAGSSAGVLWVSPPSCTPGQIETAKAIPLKACYIDQNGNSVCYSTKDGITGTVDRRSRK